MKRGYIQGHKRKEKRILLIDKGKIVDDGYTIQEDGLPPKRRSKEWREDFPKRAAAIDNLRQGDALVVADIMDLGTQPGEVIAMVGEVSKRGASVIVAGEDRKYQLTMDDAEQTIELWERSSEELRKQWGKKVRRTLKESGKPTGRKGYFAGLKTNNKKLYADVKEIWCDKALTGSMAVEAINDRLPGKDTISRDRIQAEFGYKTAAEKEYANELK